LVNTLKLITWVMCKFPSDMRYPTKEPGLATKYTHYPAELDGKCLYCGSELEEAYVTAGHRYKDFSGDVNEIRYLMRCTNPECQLYGVPYNPEPSGALPFKQFSLAVWRWVGEEAKLFNQNPPQICDRAMQTYNLSISENTVRNYIDAIDVLVANEIDAKTLKMLLVQGIILLALDGQQPEENGKALWIFTDLITSRVLHVAVLSSADSETLHGIVEGILQRYHVKLAGMVSDKQNNLTKLHDDWYPGAPHQYCHMHFLQNMWNHVEVKDTGLHQQLSKGVKHLYVASASKQAKVNLGARGKVPVREAFGGVDRDLRKILKTRTKKFEHLGGVETYDELAAYAAQLEGAAAEVGGEGAGPELLRTTAASIRTLLTEAYEAREDCQYLGAHFQEIRAWLGKECPSKGSKLSAGDRLFKRLWAEVKGHGGVTRREDLRTFAPHKGTAWEKVLQEFARLYDSYRGGLFAYYDLPASIRSNARMEQAIGQEKGRLRHKSGKSNVASQVRVRGEFELKELHAGKEEVKGIIQRMGPHYSAADLAAGLQQLASRRHEESEGWRGKKILAGLREVIDILRDTRGIGVEPLEKVMED